MRAWQLANTRLSWYTTTLRTLDRTIEAVGAVELAVTNHAMQGSISADSALPTASVLVLMPSAVIVSGQPEFSKALNYRINMFYPGH